jgi:type IV pilus assembly protein PilC
VARFAYEARDLQGLRVRGFIHAETERDVDVRLERMQLCLVRARPAHDQKVKKRASTQLLADFTYHLSTVVEAGLPLLQGLEDLVEEDGHPLYTVVADLVRKLRNGSQLSEAMSDHPKIFPPVMRALISAGEQTGRLETVLRDLVLFLEWRIALTRQIQSSLAYPCVVVVGIIALCVLVVTYVIPNFAGIFAEMGVELPLFTRVLLAVSNQLREHWPLLLLGLGAKIGLSVAVLRTKAGLRALHTAMLRTPVLGPVVTMLEMSRFAHNLAILYSAGVPLVDGLRMVHGIVQNVRIREIVQVLHDELRRGGSLADAIRKHGIVPRIVQRMIAIGESSGRLDSALERVSAFYDRELPRVITRNLAIFNTASVVLLGAVIALVGVSIFVPVYQMLGSING